VEAERTSETSVNLYQKTTRRYNPEDSHLHTHGRENLKSYSFHSTSYCSHEVHGLLFPVFELRFSFLNKVIKTLKFWPNSEALKEVLIKSG
jgi:hypothetical protein